MSQSTVKMKTSKYFLKNSKIFETLNLNKRKEKNPWLSNDQFFTQIYPYIIILLV